MYAVGFCMYGGHTTRHPRAQLVLACTAGTPHATLALSWFLHAVGFCMHGGQYTRRSRAQLILTSIHGGHTTRHPRAQLVLACTAGTPHATLALSWFLHAVGFCMHGGQYTRRSRAQLILASIHSGHTTRDHTPLSRSVDS